MTSFAIIKTGGKQYKIREGDKVKVEKLHQDEGKVFEFDEVLLYANDKDIKIGQPTIKGAKVSGKVLSQKKSSKKIVFKYKSKTRQKKKKGHRQPYTEIEITKITV